MMFMNNYILPFTITNKMLEYISSIMEKNQCSFDNNHYFNYKRA